MDKTVNKFTYQKLKKIKHWKPILFISEVLGLKVWKPKS